MFKSLVIAAVCSTTLFITQAPALARNDNFPIVCRGQTDGLPFRFELQQLPTSKIAGFVILIKVLNYPPLAIPGDVKQVGSVIRFESGKNGDARADIIPASEGQSAIWFGSRTGTMACTSSNRSAG